MDNAFDFSNECELESVDSQTEKTKKTKRPMDFHDNNEEITKVRKLTDDSSIIVEELYNSGAQTSFAPIVTNQPNALFIPNPNQQSIEINNLRNLADNGISSAQYGLGKYYIDNCNGNQDIYLEGIRYLKQAADNGYLKASFELSVAYMGSRTQWQSSYELFRLTSIRDMIIFNLEAINLDQCIQYLEYVANTGDLEARYQLAKAYKLKSLVNSDSIFGRADELVECGKNLKLAADGGHLEAQYAYSVFLCFLDFSDNYKEIIIRLGLDHVRDEAQRYRKLSADAGQMEAQHAMVVWGDSNKIKLHYVIPSALQGYHKALYVLGNMYLEDCFDEESGTLLLKQDVLQAAFLLFKATESNDSYIREESIGKLYSSLTQHGYTNEVFGYIHMLAEQGDPFAYYKRAKMLLKGKGCVQNVKLALSYFYTTHDVVRLSRAYYILGCIYRDYYSNINSALKFFEDANDIKSNVQLSAMYFDGTVVEENSETAEMYLTRTKILPPFLQKLEPKLARATVNTLQGNLKQHFSKKCQGDYINSYGERHLNPEKIFKSLIESDDNYKKLVYQTLLRALDTPNEDLYGPLTHFIYKNMNLSLMDEDFKTQLFKHVERILESMGIQEALVSGNEEDQFDQYTKFDFVMSIVRFLLDTDHQLYIRFESAHSNLKMSLVHFLERFLYSPDRGIAQNIVDKIVENYETLGLFEDHSLVQQAIRIGTVLEAADDGEDDHTNPYTFHTKLQERRKTPVDWESLNGSKERVSIHVEGKNEIYDVRVNPLYLKKLPMINVTFHELPRYSKTFLTDMMTRLALKKTLHKNGFNQAVLDLVGMSYDDLIKGFTKTQHPQTFLNVTGSPSDYVPLIAAKFIACISHIESLSIECEEGHFFSPREVKFIQMLALFQECSRGQDDSVDLCYADLPKEKQFKKDVELEDDVHISLAKRILNATIIHNVHRILMKSDWLLRRLIGMRSDETIEQWSHQVDYVKDLIAHEVGYSHEVRIDLNSRVLYKALVEKGKQEVLQAFYTGFLPTRLLDSVITEVNQEINLQKSRIDQGEEIPLQENVIEAFASLSDNVHADLFYNEMTNETTLTELGAIHLLGRLGVLKVGALIVDQTKAEPCVG